MNFPVLLLLSMIGITVAHDDYHSGGRRPPPPRPPPARPPPAKSGTRCPAGWQLWKRSQGNWCVGLFVGNMNQPAAEQTCRNMGATLTGLQTDEERRRLAASGLRMIQKHGYSVAAIWLGARRKGSCPKANMCLPKETFFWTDKHTTGTAGFGWSAGQPDGVSSYQLGTQACAHQFVFPSGSTNPRWPGIMHGQLDDQYCQEANINPSLKFYACGKKAT